MKKRFLLSLFAAGLLMSAAEMANAQYAQTTQSSTTAVATTGDNGASAAGQSSSNLITLAGCLEQGAGADEYTLLSNPTINWWEVKSDSVDLAAHLDQAVTIIAVKSPSGNGPLTVLDLAMVSDSCTRY